MTGKKFIDTNIFVYSMDSRDTIKQEIARNLIRETDNAVISAQVMQEFYNAMTKKLKTSQLEVRRMMQIFEPFETVATTPKLILEAVNLHILEQIQFWDALIIAGASSAACTYVISEDLNTGQAINGVKVINPFLVH